MNTHPTVTIVILILSLSAVLPLTVNAQTGPAQTTLASDWVKKASLPTSRAFPGAAVVDGKIYVIGGRAEHIGTHGFSENEMYDPATDTWTEKAPMPSCRGYFGIAVYQNKIYCIGGETYRNRQGTKIVGMVEVYDPATNSWETKSSIMLTARNRPQLTVVDNKIYALGGIGTPNVNEEYDPATDTWTKKADIPASNSPSIFMGASAVYNNSIYWFNKEGENLNVQVHVRVYNPQQNSWTELPTPTNSTDVSLFYFATVIGTKGSERIYLPGSSSNITFFVPATGQCLTDPKAFPGRTAYAFAVVNGAFYVIGGSEQIFTDTAKNQQFTPSTYTTNTNTTQEPQETIETNNTALWVGIAAATVVGVILSTLYLKKNRR
jgi:N-acetylneuraminic acid mutarotase